MKNTAKNAVLFVLCIIAAVLILFYQGGRDTNPAEMVYWSEMSPDGRALLIRLGYGQPNVYGRYKKQKAFVLFLSGDAPNLVPFGYFGKDCIQPVWRPNVSPKELFIVKLPRWGAQRLIAVKVSDRFSKISSHVQPEDWFFGQLKWNPAGQILAACVILLQEDGRPRRLAVSFDKGKSFNLTNIEIDHGFVWAGDNLLLGQNQNQIFEIDITNKNLRIEKNIASGGGIHLSDSLYGKAICTLENTLYFGDRPLYRSDEAFGNIHVARDLIALQTGKQIVVLDAKGEILSDRYFETDDFYFVGISAADKYVYIMKNQRSIERYAFENSQAPKVVYEVK